MGTTNRAGRRNLRLPNYWGRGGYLEQQAQARIDLLNRNNRKPEQNVGIIGGQQVDLNNNEQVAAASAGLRDREAYAQAAMKMRAENGSPTLNPYASPRVGNDSSTPLGVRTPAGGPTGGPTGGPAMNSDSVYPGGPSYESLLQPNPTPGAPTTNFVSQGGSATVRQTPDFFGEENPSPLRSNTRIQSSTLESELPAADEGLMYGGMVNKQRSVKQPGYKSGGKVKMPEGYQSGGAVCKRKGGMRGYAMGGQIGDPMQDDGRDTVDVSVREGEYMLNPPTVAAFGAGDYEAGKQVLDGISTAVNGELPGPVPVNEAGEAVEGYANGGGVRMGFGNNGAQGDLFGRGGTPLSPAEIARRQVEASRVAEAARQAQVAAEEAKMAQPKPKPKPKPTATEIPKGARDAADVMNKRYDAYGKFGERAGKVANKLKPLVSGVRGLGSAATRLPLYDTMAGMAAPDGKYYDIDPEQGIFDLRDLNGRNYHQAWNAFAEDSGNRLLTAGAGLAGTIDDVSRLAPGPGIAGAQDAYEAFLAKQFGDQVLPQNRGKAPYRTAIAGLVDQFGGSQDQIEAATPEPPPAPYGRAFGEGEVDLRNANVVMETGGPGEEKIIREDIDGVPTFTNVRRGGFDGTPANLQREADQRVAEDTARERAALALQRERLASATPESSAAVLAAQAKSTPGSDDLMKSVQQRFTVQGRDEAGNLTKPVEDREAARTFMDAMSRLIDPNTGRTMAEVLEGMTEGQRAPYYEQFQDEYRNTMLAIQAARAQNRPISDQLRAGDKGLRLESTNREVRLGDVFGPDATLGDWWKGLGNDDPALNRYVEDPISGAVIPASRVTDDGLRYDEMKRLGLL